MFRIYVALFIDCGLEYLELMKKLVGTDDDGG